MKRRVLAVLLAIGAIGLFAYAAQGTTEGTSDPAGDVSEPKADIISSGVTYADGQIGFAVAVTSPTNPDTDANWNNNASGILWNIDTNGDNTGDFVAVYGKAGGAVLLPDLQTLKCQATRTYNGSNQVQYFLQFPKGCINNPTTIKIATFMRYKNGSAEAVTDSAPDNQTPCCAVTETVNTTTTNAPGSTTTTTPGSTTTTVPGTTTTTSPPTPGAQITTGAGAGGAPHVQKFDSNGTAGAPGFYGYDQSYSGGVPVARGDLTNDPGEEIVVGSGVGGNAFRVFSATGATLFGGNPFGVPFKGGIEVAVGDVTGDGTNEIIVAAGPGGGPHVRILDNNGAAIGDGFYAYPSNFTGGVHVAVGQVSGGGKQEIITGAGAGGAPHVRAFDAAGVGAGPGFYAYGQNFGGGVYVASADGRIITGAGPGAAPHVRSFDVNGVGTASFYAFPESFHGGVRVATADLVGNSTREIITGAGPGGAPHVRVFNADGTSTSTSFYAYSQAFSGGVFVAGSPR